MTEDKQMWEILVPTQNNDGKPYKTRYHRVWDQKVYEIAGGVTILTPSKGKWVSPVSGKLFEERMIPVRIACTEQQINDIVDMTMEYYDQEAILAYRIANQVVLRYREVSRG